MPWWRWLSSSRPCTSCGAESARVSASASSNRPFAAWPPPLTGWGGFIPPILEVPQRQDSLPARIITYVTDDRELFRFQKADELRIYTLRVIPGGAELWRTTTRGDEPATSIKEDDFSQLEQVVDTLRELEQRLKAGGWRSA